jgi:hypothetical protein
VHRNYCEGYEEDLADASAGRNLLPEPDAPVPLKPHEETSLFTALPLSIGCSPSPQCNCGACTFSLQRELPIKRINFVKEIIFLSRTGQSCRFLRLNARFREWLSSRGSAQFGHDEAFTA